MVVVHEELPKIVVFSLHLRRLNSLSVFAVHGVVLVFLKLRGTLTQPVAVFSNLSSTVFHTKDQI